MHQRTQRILSALFVFWLSVLAPVIGFAQTTTGASIQVVTGSQSTQLLDANGNVVSRDYIPDHPFWVNRRECEADWVYQIGITSAGINGAPFEVWASAGGDCTTVAARFPPTPSCWKIYYEGGFNQGTSGTRTIYIPARTIVGAHMYTSGIANSTTPPIAGTKDDCNPQNRTDIVPSAGESLTLYFFAYTNGGTTPTVTATWGDVGFDLIGPSPPASISVSAADTQLYVNWAQVLDSDLAGYHIYCGADNLDAGVAGTGGSSSTSTTNATGGSTATGGSSTDGGASAAGGATTGGTTSTSTLNPVPNDQCPNFTIQQGMVPPTGFGFQGRADGVTPTSGIASGLQNGKTHACAVAAYDTRENDGVFSMVQCGTPWWVNDFYTQYKTNGGKAGGGFCSIGHRASTFGLLLPLASLCLLALRRGRLLMRRSDRSSAKCRGSERA